MQSISLKDGSAIPGLGLGTWQLRGDECSRVVAEAIGMGYRHIDTAFAYGNHAAVAAGIAKSGIAREELYLTTKIPMSRQSRSEVLALGDEVRSELGTDYVDLLLVHWPTRSVPFEETFAAMHELVKRGTVRSIGVSNFNPELVRQANEISPDPIVTNQVEFHPYLYQRKLLETCESLDVRVTAYSPIAKAQVTGDERLEEIGRAHGASAIQVSIA